jgi:L-ascorbate metabolism protein UlaG (beta-lactamase superfamily)
MTRRKLLLTLLGAPLAAAGWFGWSRNRNPYYSGPRTDHFDGLRFFNPDHRWSKTPIETMRAVWLGDRVEWPESWPSPFPTDKPPARVQGSGLRVTAVGHATHLIQAAGLNILTDPVWSERASPVRFAGPKRVVAPGIAFDDLPKIDIVLLSHDHYDHLDLDTLARIEKRDRPRVIVPLGNNAIIKANDPSTSAEAHDWGAVVPLGGGVTATLAPAYHWSARSLTDRRKALWCAYSIDFGAAGKVYFGGDSGFGPGTIFRTAGETLGPFRLAIIPIGAYEPRWFMGDQHMNPAEAVEAFKMLKAEAAIGCHWGVFRLTAEAIDAPEKDLAVALRGAGIAPDRFRAMRPGEVWESA